MGNAQPKLISDEGEDEGYPGYGRKISLNMVNKLAHSVCKLTVKENKEKIINSGTGFFMMLNLEEKKLNCLITNYHVISQTVVDAKQILLIQIEKDNKEIEIKLDNSKRFIKCLERPTDITIIEIIDSDKILKDVNFLMYDLNYLSGYEQYEESDIIILQHPLGQETQIGIGKILNIKYFEFEHSIETDSCSSGSPVILIGNSKVVGIHKQMNKRNNNGIGTFIGEIFNEIKKRKITCHTEIDVDKKFNEENNFNIKNDIILYNENNNINNNNNYYDFKILKRIFPSELRLMSSKAIKIRSKLKIYNY